MRLDMPWGRLPAFIMGEPPHWRWTSCFLKNAEAAPDIHSEIALALGVQADKAPVATHAKMGAKTFSDFIRRTGIEISLKPDGLTRNDLNRLVDTIQSNENTPMCENNCYTASAADIRDFARQLLSR
jgi:alcohol dehydrogenase class IV